MDSVLSAQYDALQGNAGHNSTESCCDAMCPFSLACAFMALQSVYAAVYGDSALIPYSAFIARPIYLRVVIPPPKA